MILRHGTGLNTAKARLDMAIRGIQTRRAAIRTAKARERYCRQWIARSRSILDKLSWNFYPGGNMKRSTLSLTVAFFLAVAIAQAAAPKTQNDQTMKARTFSGEIMDSACAQMGSHKQMEAKEGAKNAKDCTMACVKNGSSLVLYNPSTKKTYQLSDQDKAKEYAGDWVRVRGTYDSSSQTITVDTITRSHTRASSTSGK
jgi:hypothetical protein